MLMVRCRSLDLICRSVFAEARGAAAGVGAGRGCESPAAACQKDTDHDQGPEDHPRARNDIDSKPAGNLTSARPVGRGQRSLDDRRCRSWAIATTASTGSRLSDQRMRTDRRRRQHASPLALQELSRRKPILRTGSAVEEAVVAAAIEQPAPPAPQGAGYAGGSDPRRLQRRIRAGARAGCSSAVSPISPFGVRCIWLRTTWRR